VTLRDDLWAAIEPVLREAMGVFYNDAVTMRITDVVMPLALARADTMRARPERAPSHPGEATLGRMHIGASGTEVSAAVMAFPRTGTQRLAILRYVHGSHSGLTDEEIARMPGIADTAHRTRRRELVDGGWIVDSGVTRKTRSGADSVVWVTTEKAKPYTQGW
jgi:hypothetical protein